VAAVKKVVIPRSQLIPVDGSSQTLVRFRIISDDRNRFSEWSSIFSVTTGEEISLTAARFASASLGSIVTIAWDGLPSGISLDIFISEDGEDMTYSGTTSDNRYIFIRSAEADTYQFSIQVSSINKAYEESLQIFESEVFDVV